MINIILLNPTLKDKAFVAELHKSKKYKICCAFWGKKRAPAKKHFKNLPAFDPKRANIKEYGLLIELSQAKGFISKILSDNLTDIKIIPYGAFKTISKILSLNPASAENLLDITEKHSYISPARKNLDEKFLEFAITMQISKLIKFPLISGDTVELIFNILSKKLNIGLCAVTFFGKRENEMFIASGGKISDKDAKTVKNKARAFAKKYSAAPVILKETTALNGPDGSRGAGGKLKYFYNLEISSGEEAFGVLTLASARGGITAKDADFVRALSRQFALFIENELDRKKIVDEKNIIESIVQSMTEGVIFIGNDGRVSIINNAAKSILDIKKDLSDKKIEFALRNKELSEILKVIQSNVSNFIYKEIKIEESAARKNKTIRCYALKTFDRSKKPIGVTLVLTDITHEKEINMARTEFVSTASHELRAPLSSIKESLLLLLEDKNTHRSEEEKSLLRIARKNIDRLSNLVNDLLDISKIEAGKMKFHMEKSDITRLIEESVLTFSATAKEKSIEFITKLEKTLPELYLDRARILQALANLLSNALKFTPHGGKITVEAVHHPFNPNFVQVCVSDTGAGIENKDMHRVFKKFQQFTKTAGSAQKGTGLGLAITKDIIDNHGGNIWVESEQGKGCRFIFLLPVEKRVAEGKQKRILIIDSDLKFTQIMSSYLEKNNFSVITAQSARDAVKKAKTALPDLIIMDTAASDINTYRISGILRRTANTSKIPIIMLGGIGKNGAKIKDIAPYQTNKYATQLKADAIIEKSETADELLKTVNLLLNG